MEENGKDPRSESDEALDDLVRAMSETVEPLDEWEYLGECAGRDLAFRTYSIFNPENNSSIVAVELKFGRDDKCSFSTLIFDSEDRLEAFIQKLIKEKSSAWPGHLEAEWPDEDPAPTTHAAPLDRQGFIDRCVISMLEIKHGCHETEATLFNWAEKLADERERRMKSRQNYT